MGGGGGKVEFCVGMNFVQFLLGGLLEKVFGSMFFFFFWRWLLENSEEGRQKKGGSFNWILN